MDPMPRGYMAQPPAVPKVGLEARGAALAVATGACIAGGWSLLQDHDERRLKKSVLGGSLAFLGSYLFLRGSRFDDSQTAAVVAAAISLASLISYTQHRGGWGGGQPPRF